MASAGQPTSPRTCWRDPRRHITAKRRSEKLTRHRRQPMTAEYCRKARGEALERDPGWLDGPKPPDAAKTWGMKEAISTSRTRWSYWRRLLLLVAAEDLLTHRSTRCAFLKTRFVGLGSTYMKFRSRLLHHKTAAGQLFWVPVWHARSTL